MNTASFGAYTVVDTLLQAGVDTFFANPRTSEIHLVSAIDANPRARAVLCLFEGVATGAADGYARAAGKPAAVLLHLGPGLANGLANLHNALKARSPMVVLVGEHASSHLAYDTPLKSDLDALPGYAAKTVIHMQPGDDLAAAMCNATDVVVEEWYALMAPAGTPDAITRKLSREVSDILTLPAIREKMDGLDVEGATPEKTGHFINGEMDRWDKFIKLHHITAE